jgi:hypothetical protein
MNQKGATTVHTTQGSAFWETSQAFDYTRSNRQFDKCILETWNG